MISEIEIPDSFYEDILRWGVSSWLRQSEAKCELTLDIKEDYICFSPLLNLHKGFTCEDLLPLPFTFQKIFSLRKTTIWHLQSGIYNLPLCACKHTHTVQKHLLECGRKLVNKIQRETINTWSICCRFIISKGLFTCCLYQFAAFLAGWRSYINNLALAKI